MKKSTVFILAIALGAIAANLYYAQPILGLIAESIHLEAKAAGLVVTLTQAGYGFGVLLLVPLGDILETKKLVLSMIFVSSLGVLGLAFASSIYTYFLAALVTGVGASAVQVLVPYTSHLVSVEKRGQVVGTLMSGLMVGIMLSRPVSSFLTDLFGWHSVFIFSAGLMLVIGITLNFVMPKKEPTSNSTKYSELLKSMIHLYKTEEIIRRRSIYQAFMFAAFCIFWTASPLYLINEFHFTQSQIAIFALVGVAGAISAPFAGRYADKGYITIGTYIALGSACLSFVVGSFYFDNVFAMCGVLALCAILLDAGVSANLVLGQRAIFSLPANLRSRINGLYVATIFIGGAFGSAVGAWAFEKGGWQLTSWIGFSMPLLAFLYSLTEKKEFKENIKARLAEI